jgi:inhibitor of cysteine peptidase
VLVIIVRSLTLVTLSVALLVGCRPATHSPTHSPTQSTVVTVQESDAGKNIDAKAGQTIVIRLTSNRSTGYRWLLQPGSGVLESLSDASYTPNAPSDAGGGGVESWSFRAQHSGQETLRFEYRRPWENGVQAAKTLSFPVTVR